MVFFLDKLKEMYKCKCINLLKSVKFGEKLLQQYIYQVQN